MDTAQIVEGTGLGLYVAREIAKAHGGNVWAESGGLDKGSAFYMKLPVKNVIS
ncbi:MAG: ATP-binding protein [Candidatus Paceibacterota bacterium]